MIQAGHVAACHDLSDGGLLVALTEMGMAGGRGATLDQPGDMPPHAWLFGEDQGRYLVETADSATVLAAAQVVGVPAMRVGSVGAAGEGAALTLRGTGAISVAQLTAENEAWLPAYMAQG